MKLFVRKRSFERQRCVWGSGTPPDCREEDLFFLAESYGKCRLPGAATAACDAALAYPWRATPNGCNVRAGALILLLRGLHCAQNIGKAFTDHYYNTFDGPGGDGSTRANLQGLYQDSSVCTWDGKQMMGMMAIMTELTTFQTRAAPPIRTLQHKVIKCDCQPITTGSGILVQIIGDMCVNGDGVNLIKFSHVRARHYSTPCMSGCLLPGPHARSVMC